MKEILLELLAQRKLLLESLTNNRCDHGVKCELLKHFDNCYKELLIKCLENETKKRTVK